MTRAGALLVAALAACDSNGPPPLVTETLYPPQEPPIMTNPPICCCCGADASEVGDGVDAMGALDAGEAGLSDQVTDGPDTGDGPDGGTRADAAPDADACAPSGCTGSCADLSARNVPTVIDGCVVWQCCVPADASAGGDAADGEAGH